MSQVRKLLNGNKIIKAQDGYKFQLDSQDVYFTDDDLKEIDKRIATLPMEYRKFLGNATTAIKLGTQAGNRAENTVTMDQLSNLGKSDIKRLEKKKGSYFESIVQPDSYSAKQAIDAYLNILYSIANKRSTKEKIGKDEISLVFNPGENDTYSLSTTAGNNYAAKTRILDLLDSVNAGKDYKYDVSDWDLKWLPSWMASLTGEDKNKAATDYVDALWTRMTSGYDPKLNPDDINFLKNFNISYGFDKPTVKSEQPEDNSASVKQQDVINGKPVNNDGEIDYTKRQANGAYLTWNEPDGSIGTNSKEGDGKPYLLSSPERLAKYGLGPEYIDSVLFKGKIYKPSQVTPETNLDLYNTMQSVITTNNSIRNPNELFARLADIIDYTDYDTSKYGYYNPEMFYWNNAEIRKELGRTGNYSVFDATQAYNVDPGTSIYGFYDYNTPGTEQWGFRSPFYLIVDENGELHVSANGSPRFSTIPDTMTMIPNMEYGAAPGYNDWTTIDGRQYGVVATIPAAEPSRPPYTIYEDFDGNWYWNNSSRGIIRIQNDLKRALKRGHRPTPTEMETGMLEEEYRPAESRKSGGLIQLKPLPQKYQKGSKLLTRGQATPDVLSEEHDPLSASVKISDATAAENFWNALSSAEKEEIIATSIDLGGAVAGVTGPVGSIAGAITGLGSTGMFLDAAKKRKGKTDWTDWGQAALSTLLDVVSVLPWVGEAGKVAKIGSKIQKVAAPLGKMFTLMGLSAAASVVTKPIKDWTTDDLVKLSSGLQAAVNISSGVRVGRGESRLAARLSKDAPEVTSVTYKSKNKYKVGETEQHITLSDDEVRAVVNSEKDPDGVLKGILKGESHGIKEEDLPSSGKELLEDFGFKVKQHGRKKNRYLEASEIQPETPQKFSKYGYLLDPIRIHSNPEIRRRAYIDERLTSDPELARSLGLQVTSTTHVTPRETITTTRSESPLGKSERRAYISSLARTGQAEHGRWRFRTPIDEGIGERTSVEKTELQAAETAAALNAQYRFAEEPGVMHELAVQRAQDLPGVYADVVKDDLIYSVRAATRPADKPKPGRSSRLGAESVSNKELVDYILGSAEEPGGITNKEAVTFLNSLSDRKRKGLLRLLRNSGDTRGLEIANHFDELGTQRVVGEKISKGTDSTSKAIEKVKERGKASQKRKMKEMADNLKKLRESKDPMKTLSKIASTESSRISANENPTEYREALNEALREAIYTKLNGPRLDRYLNNVKKQMQRDGLMFRRGGILKAQNGGGWLKQIGRWYNKVTPILSAIRLGTNIGYNDKAIDASQRSAEKSKSHWIDPNLTAPALDNSAFERQLKTVQEERMSNNQNITNDVIANNALKMQKDAQLYQRENSIIAGINQNNVAHNAATTEIENQKAQNRATVTNHTNDSIAAAESAKEQVEAQRALLTGKNLDNFLYEMEYGISKDQELLKNASLWRLRKNQEKELNDFFKEHDLTGVNAYNALTADQQAQYSSLRDYLQRRTGSIFDNYREALEALEDRHLNEEAEFGFGNTVFLPNIPMTFGPVISRKKGGYLRGNTRYKNEPDEQVWIDSNKAVHAAVAKLQDNTIKLLLRALK